MELAPGNTARRDPSDDSIAITLDRRELRTIVSAIGEAIEALEDWEFPIRVGASIQEARDLRAQLDEVLALQPNT